MTFQPVLPALVLAGVAVAILLARVIAWRQLPPAARTRGARWRWCGLTLAALLLIASATRPVLEPTEPGASRVADAEALNVFLIVDRSPDMGVTDYPQGDSRMAVARQDMAALIDRHPGARVAVISFAARPTLDWPLSVDTWSLRPLISTFEPYRSAPDAVTQTNAGAASNLLRYQLIGARQQYPRAKTLVYYLGAGAAESQTPAREFDLPAGTVSGGAVLGYGTANGGPIPGTDVPRSAIDEPVLRGVAAEIGVPYLPRGDRGPLASDSPGEAAAPAPQQVTIATPSARIELYWFPATLAAILILVELCLVLREFRRTRLMTRNVLQ